MYGDTDPMGMQASMPPPNGPFFPNRVTRIAQLVDGTSNTAMVSERIMGDYTNGISSRDRDVYNSPATPTTLDEAYRQCDALDVNNLALQGSSVSGSPWINGTATVTTYKHASPPRKMSCFFRAVGRLTIPPNSDHPGGVNLALGDGSVRFVKDSIDLKTWQAIGSMNGREAVSADSF